MESMGTKTHRFAAATLTGMTIAMVVIGISWWVAKNPQTRPLQEALWVCDWDITKIYGPGTPEQAAIVEQFRAKGLSNLKFTAPILYRMETSSSGDSRDPREGILMSPFDPKHPEAARALAASRGPGK